ncbi:hypothetical protein [Qipengyuania qiaonensis]|uniref:DUF3168 domain-containing protein n=1 Tax=Qipengyuania qiaonensis TaxID=2867240 RepID=A0ABS7JA96_9SPHN|nr:hypothetical protein [Qipengyuania qiaonensis]MBX7484176.1 hypothetical protein [Qipengyuania qiaonensis]
MTAEDESQPDNNLARHLARKGPAEVEKFQTIVDLARQLLASGEVQLYGEGENPFAPTPYPWETTEAPADASRHIFLGTVSDLASGQGHTVWFAAGLARNEDEFRRQLAAHIGYVRANGADVNRGLGDFQLSATFISPPLRQTLAKFEKGAAGPFSFFYLTSWHENWS